MTHLLLYVTDDEIEVELLDFSLEPVLEKVMPNFVRKIKYKSDFEAIKLMENIINDISKNVKVEATAIIFNKFFNYQTGFAYSENGSGLEIYDLSVTLKNSKAILPPALHNVFVGDTVLAYTLYLREKVFESQSIVYYDLDKNAVCYIMNNILQKSTNPVSGMIIPRFTQEQSEFFENLKNVVEAIRNKSDFADKKALTEVISVLDEEAIQYDAKNDGTYCVDNAWRTYALIRLGNNDAKSEDLNKVAELLLDKGLIYEGVDGTYNII